MSPAGIEKPLNVLSEEIKSRAGPVKGNTRIKGWIKQIWNWKRKESKQDSFDLSLLPPHGFFYPSQGEEGGMLTQNRAWNSTPWRKSSIRVCLYAFSSFFQIGIRLDFSTEIGCISISSSFAIRDNLNDLDGQPAYTYSSHLVDTSGLHRTPLWPK